MSEASAGARPTVYSIPPHRSFVDALVVGLLDKHGRDPMQLARGRILVPTNRAARSLRDAFVRAAGEWCLLPRLVPIGDPELGERLGLALDPIDAEPLPPAIAPDERLLVLAGLLRGSEARASAVSALREARDLARALDQLTIEEKSPEDLRALAPEARELQAHWQHLYDKLGLVFGAWPELLAERGAIDLATRRNRLLDRLAARWRETPPDGFTVAAGITTTAPAVARLLGTIARLPAGMVVLPALAREREMPAPEWDALAEERGAGAGAGADAAAARPSGTMLSHPQYHLRLLLDRMGVGRGEVRDWHRRGDPAAPPERSRAIAHAMAAARYTDKWQGLAPLDRRFGDKVRAATFPDPAAEAAGIALALRRALEEPGKTAALVTPDRALARRVGAILARWGIAVDDSAGEPLDQTPPATLLLRLLGAIEEDWGPIATLALAKHPLVGGAGGERGDWLRRVRRLDRALRGARPGPGLDGLARRLKHDADREAFAALRGPLETAATLLAPTTSLAELARALHGALEALAGERVWTGAAGRELSSLIETLETSPAAAEFAVPAGERQALWRSLMGGRSVRRPYGGHPRIQLLGLLEARLLQSELMILGGLNEGSWPADSGTDPWLAPRLRRLLGLPGLDSRIGLAAHDFMSALGAPDVLLTRALRDARSPTIASRFWLRLEALSGGLPRDAELEQLAGALDRPAAVRPAPQPRPAPPVVARPRTLPVTAIEQLRADPYAFYARRILGLRALEPLENPRLAAWQGNRVHELLERWVERDDADPAALEPRLEALLGSADIHPMLRALWGPRLREGLDFILGAMAADKAAGRVPRAVEIEGRAPLHGITLHGIADRLDRCADGGIAIVDYKTGTSPDRKAVDAEFALQLGLLGLLAREGGFGGEKHRPVALEYWKLGKVNGRFGQRMAVGQDGIEAYLAAVDARLQQLARDYLFGEQPFVAKLNPAFAPYGDYDQLMRLEEWYGREA
ncbi:double-strand break repair protein AddB [Sphingomicrobium astaxanthinifaciens]|uniref:double-strand break repair protein AddB n=1 Tax=Sphingomicrobium astaxanthinifaciens TaxID=1227949 RepID=UPI001FCC11DB|nr:double-strand break repair protein AddB [Sphingomicrobium astaxanthinifaciens]MCJ7422298.1 double-strand break repair protein AddB [Sphingomicrobium astaxanthinifaciens]